MTASALYAGVVVHRRYRPVRHRLRHRVFFMLLDLDEVPALDSRLRLFSHNRFNLTSFFDRDHGPRDGSPLRPWVEKHLKRAGLFDPDGRIVLACFPRLFGFVFNPLSVYYCFDRTGRLTAVLHEVRNTFGEMHGYLLPALPDDRGIVRQQADKGFYVSPFIPMEARYAFRLTVPGPRYALSIREWFSGGLGLTATMTGAARPFTDAALARLVAAHPLMTLKIVAAIHWNALRLWLKGARYHRKPRPPETDVTVPPSTGVDGAAEARLLPDRGRDGDDPAHRPMRIHG